MKHPGTPDPIIKFDRVLTQESANTSFITEFAGALFNTRRLPNVIVPRAAPTFAEQARYLGKLWAVGIVLMTAATWAMVRLEIFDRPGTAVLVYLLIIVVLSLLDSFLTSAIFSVIAVGCIDFFFIVPLYTFEIAHAQDVVALAAFILTSFVITTLVRRARHFGEAQHEQARLLDLTRDAVLVIDVNRVITYWNRGAERLFGWSKDEAIGREVQLLLKTKYPAPLDELVEESKRAGYWEGELMQTTRDGEQIFVQSRWVLRRDRLGRPIGTLQSNIDITARKRAEEALLQSQATYTTEAQRLSHTGSFGWNVTTGELIWSDETFRIFDYDNGMKPTLQMALDRIHPDDREAVLLTLNTAVNERQPLDLELRLRMPDGSDKNLRIVGRPLAEQAGNFKLVGAVMDVTSHKVAYAALENSESRYRHLFKFMPISLWKLDVLRLMQMFDELKASGITDFPAYLKEHPEFYDQAAAVIVAEEANDVTVRMFGAGSQQDLLGSVGRFFAARPDTMVRILESRFHDEALFEEKTQLVTLDGRVIDVLLTAARTEYGITLAGLVELTDLVRAQETLEKLQIEFAHAARVSTLGELTASIAHELNQPLAAIVTNCEAGTRWLDRPEPNLDEVRALTRRSLADARRAADIIARVRSMAARRAPERVLVSPHDVILEALQFLRHEVEWRGVTISRIFSPEAPQVMADRTLLHQVLVNLAVNAMQAMAQDGTIERKITVRTDALDGRLLRCSVEDSGPGIKADHLPQLFESFFTTKEGGMGMGLSICRSIIEAHGGRIEADNESSHGGARFAFTLPAAGGTLHLH